MQPMFLIWPKYSKNITKIIKKISILNCIHIHKSHNRPITNYCDHHLLPNLVISPSDNASPVINQQIIILNYHNFKSSLTPIESHQFTRQEFNLNPIFNQVTYLKFTKNSSMNMTLFYKMISIQKEIHNGSFLV